MNIELIKKYKTEFDHFLNGGNLLTRTKSDFIWNDEINENLMWNFEIQDIDIIIDDEFSELRKALCDGKIIQIWGVLEQHVSEASKDIYGWKDFKSFKPNSPFGGEIHNYRIKPEEPKFKAGDFIRQTKELGINVSRIYRIKAHISDILYSVEKNIYDVDAINAKEEYFELWKPSHKELCYFTHDTNTKTSATLREFREISEDGFYVDCFGTRFIYCEPFLSSKPSWFKDKQ